MEQIKLTAPKLNIILKQNKYFIIQNLWENFLSHTIIAVKKKK